MGVRTLLSITIDAAHAARSPPLLIQAVIHQQISVFECRNVILNERGIGMGKKIAINHSTNIFKAL
jgi:hypothetical protein